MATTRDVVVSITLLLQCFLLLSVTGAAGNLRIMDLAPLDEDVKANAIHTLSGSSVSPCSPITGKTALVIGQDLYSITNYTASTELQRKPFGLMSYTALKSDLGELTGLKKPIEYGSGIEWVDGLIGLYPKSSIQLGLWLVDQCGDVVSGLLDHNIQRLAKFMKDRSKHTSFYLRIGYEFDRSENKYEPSTYRVAFQRIVNIFREVNATNVAFVWHASGFPPRNNLPLKEWYPGSKFVDWCGISLFQQPYSCGGAEFCVLPYVQDMLRLCNEKNIPVMIAESTPFGGIVQESDMVQNPDRRNEAGFEGDSWVRWYLPVLRFIEEHDIRLFSYINSNWDTQPMWQGEKWGDSRIEAYPSIQKKWTEYVLQSPRFLLSYEDTTTGSSRCTVPRTQLLPHHDMELPDDDDTVAGDKDHPDPKNDDHSSHGGGSVPHHRRDFYTNTERVLLKDTRAVLIFLLELCQIFMLLAFLVACFVLIVSCLYKCCSPSQWRGLRTIGGRDTNTLHNQSQGVAESLRNSVGGISLLNRDRKGYVIIQ